MYFFTQKTHYLWTFKVFLTNVLHIICGLSKCTRFPAIFCDFGGHIGFHSKTVSVTLLKVAYFNYWAKITYNFPYCMPRYDDFITNQLRPVYYLYGSHLGLSRMATKGCVNLGESGFGILFCYFKLAKLSKYISYNAQQPYTPVHYIPVFKPFSVILAAILNFKQQPSM